VQLKLEKDGLNVGGGVPLGDILNALKKDDNIENNTTLGAFREHLSHIGNTQLRNTITVGGITATNEELGDFVPFLIASVLSNPSNSPSLHHILRDPK